MPRVISKITKIDENEIITLKKRIDIATAIILFLISILVVRLWFLQIHQGADYGTLSEKNRIRMQEIAAPRGNILDRKGRNIITNRPCFNIVWVREDAPNPDEVIKRLAKILDKDITAILDKIRTAVDLPRHIPVRLEEDIDWKTLVNIENRHFELPGIRIEALPTRDYLYKDLASHTIGYLGEVNQKDLSNPELKNYQSGDQIGKMGIEKLFEEYLRGDKGHRFIEVDVQGFEQKQLTKEEPLPGNDIQLTIDIDIQYAAEQAMKDKAGAVVAIEVNTGKILALTSSPQLNLKHFVGGISQKNWNKLLNNHQHPLLNKTIQGQYPPGSTYKIITALAALTEGVVTEETVFYCSGSLVFGNRRYGCWKRGGHGAVNLHRALKESCDVYFYQAGLKLGVDKLAFYADNLGLGHKTNIRLEHEKAGLVPTSEWKLRKRQEPWQEGETLSISIGQGFNLATPLQICTMTAAIVNGGVLLKPQFIESIRDPDGNIIKEFSSKHVTKKLGSKEHLEMIKNALVAAVNEKHGTGGRTKLKGITVGGKTGTSQVVRLSKFKNVPDKEIPYKYRDHAWFTCFAPAEKPEIAVTVLIEHGGHGGSAAAPVAKEVLMRYFDMKPDKKTAGPKQTAAQPSSGRT